MTRRVSIIVAALIALSSPALAQHNINDAYQAANNAVDAGDWALAEEVFEKLTTLDERNFVPWYNLACARARLGKVEPACDALEQAVSLGFADLYRLHSDPDLRAIRDNDRYVRLVAQWPKVLEAQIDSRLKLAERQYREGPPTRGGYVYERDERLRLAYVAGFDEQDLASAKLEVQRVANWAEEHLFPDIFDKDAMTLDPWVLIVLPHRKDFRKWALQRYGPAAINDFHQIGGSYDHDAKTLVAQDLGATLRHEYLHVLHWRDNVRKQQAHPIWIQEGLCSLVEDYDPKGGLDITITPSWRSNIVKRLQQSGNLPPIEQIAAMPRNVFTGRRPLANYAHARTIFLYMLSEGKLREWYRTYTQTYSADPTGVTAIERVFAQPMDAINDDYQEWVAGLPEIPEQITSGMASLGVEVDAGKGEGPVIVAVSRDARKAGLKPGDVISSIDERSTRDMNELVRVIGSMQVGAEVSLGVRRGRRHLDVRLTLVAK